MSGETRLVFSAEVSFSDGENSFTIASIQRSPYNQNINRYFEELCEYLSKIGRKNSLLVGASDFKIYILNQGNTCHRFLTLVDTFNLETNISQSTGLQKQLIFASTIFSQILK